MARRRFFEALDLAGFTDSRSHLGRFVPTGHLLVPKHIRLDEREQHLVCDYRAGFRTVQPTRDLLDGFMQLPEAPPPVLLQYAQRWGLLFLDPRGRPCSKEHAGTDSSRPEPLEAWRYYSHRARAILHLAANLQQGKRGSASDWDALDAIDKRIGDKATRELRRRGLLDLYAYVGAPDTRTASVEKQQRYLVWELTLWLDLTRPGFALKAHRQSWQLEIDYNGCLLAAIALQLALTVAGARTLFTCSGCGVAYVRARAAKTGQANFCPHCGQTEALRQADQRRRRKVAEARRLFAAGWTIRRIIKQLQVRSTTRSDALSTVRRWVDLAH